MQELLTDKIKEKIKLNKGQLLLLYPDVKWEGESFLDKETDNLLIFKKYFIIKNQKLSLKHVFNEFLNFYENNKGKKGYLIINYSNNNIDNKYKIFLNSYLSYAERLFPLGCVFPPFSYNDKLELYHEIKNIPILNNLKLGFFLQLLYLNKFKAEPKFYGECKELTEKILLF